MLVHIVSRPLTHAYHVPVSAITQLARSLESAGATVIQDVWAIPTNDMATSVSACALELAQRWREQKPDIVHTIGIVATMAAIKVGADVPPIVATFDERPSRREVEAQLAQHVSAVMPLSLDERERWRRMGVRTLWTGSFPFAVPVSDHYSCAAADGDVVTLAAGPDLDVVVSSMPYWNGRLVVAARLAPGRQTALRARAQHLGVWDRIVWRPGLRDLEREQMWSRAAVLVAGREGSRHGGHVLEAAAHGVPAVAAAQEAHVDHVVPRATGVLVQPNATARTWGRAIASVLTDSFGLRAMGTSSLVRIRTLHSSALAGRRLMSMYGEVVPTAPVASSAPAVDTSETVLRSDEDRNALALEHLALARQLAGWYSGRGQAREDLVQVASLGLVRAAERFDPAYGKEFHSFAIPTILGELRKHFRDHAWAVRVPRGLQETTLAVQRASGQVSQSLSHEATAMDLADELGLVEEEVLLALRAEGEARSSHSLDHPVGDEGSVGDLVGEIDPALEFVELSEGVGAALARLPDREQQILLLRFYGERTQSEIAERLGISQVHVSRVLTRTLALLRDHVLEDVPLPKSWERELVPAAGIPSRRRVS